MYLKNIRKNSRYLVDENGVSVFSPFGDISSTYLVKEAAISAFYAFTKMDATNQRKFFRLLHDEMVRFAHFEYDWDWLDCAGRISGVLFPDDVQGVDGVYESHCNGSLLKNISTKEHRDRERDRLRKKGV
jgi:hypothetical protein